MASKILSISVTGLECEVIEVQADISNGLPAFSITGLGDASVMESRERVRASIKNSGASFPQTKKVVNLAPAQIKKTGAIFDLPIAVSILIESRQIPINFFENAVIVGELSLSGKVKGINGALAITQHAKEKGFKRIILPSVNALEASFIPDIEIIPIDSLKKLIDFSLRKKYPEPHPHSKIENFIKSPTPTLQNIIGLEKAKRALSICAAGGHNLLLYGSPGFGKTILCRAFSSLLPQMTTREILETTKIFSISGLLPANEPLITHRPFREVHHTASVHSITGGGAHPKPGEISLAHNGVLFFDEIAEFPRSVLEALRQPLEDKFINITRVNYSSRFPCNFIFIATMNPCPCGFHNDRKIKCKCTESQVKNYKKKISGPIMDRFDLFIEIPNTPLDNIFAKQKSKKDPLNDEICLAQKARLARQIKNADMTLRQIQEFAILDKKAEDLLRSATKSLHLSNRAYLKSIKVARTIADMTGSSEIRESHISEALQYRERN